MYTMCIHVQCIYTCTCRCLWRSLWTMFLKMSWGTKYLASIVIIQRWMRAKLLRCRFLLIIRNAFFRYGIHVYGTCSVYGMHICTCTINVFAPACYIVQWYSVWSEFECWQFFTMQVAMWGWLARIKDWGSVRYRLLGGGLWYGTSSFNWNRLPSFCRPTGGVSLTGPM